MIQKILIKLLLAPFSILYGLGIIIRNAFYDIGFLKSISFSIPIISVGNLSVGGAGKSPHVEYLTRLLKEHLHLGILSRGYRRKTKGFLNVSTTANSAQVGDEPLQFKLKYPDIHVAVSESRTLGIPAMLKSNPGLQTIILDDAFQHRAVKPGLNLLLTEHDHPFYKDHILPSGRLREWRSSASRADAVIITKCPKDESRIDRQNISKNIHSRSPDVPIFYSYYEYHYPYQLYNYRNRINLSPELDILLVSAIASSDYMISFLNEKVGTIKNVEFEDHHYFTKHDLARIKTLYEQMEGKNKIILTTEKDATRLALHRQYIIENKLPIFVLPVEVKFHFSQKDEFDIFIKDYLTNFRV
jgi:tetraacyldisaccharide 4'-kinase